LLNRSVYLVLNGAFLSGIIFIGTQVLLSAAWQTALLLAVLSLGVYLAVVCTAYKLTSSLLGPRLKEYGETKLKWTVAATIATITAFAMIPYAIGLNIAVTNAISSPRYYFYAAVMATIVFITTALNFSRGKDSQVGGLDTLKAQFSLSLELIRALLWAFAFTIFGTAYAQVVTTTGTFSAGEMILILYTLVGVMGFVFVPIGQDAFGILDEIRKQETMQQNTA
jgi:hypothetical protein